MTRDNYNPKEIAFGKFDRMGLDQVRLQYGGVPPQGGSANIKQLYSWAKEWLAPHERGARLANEASQSESLATAISAKDAAWAAASAASRAATAAETANQRASTANTIATLALIAAVIAIAFSVIGLFLN